jgi:hypothetical protein
MGEEQVDPDKLCFVVGPIGADDSADRVRADWLLEMVIQPVMEDFPQFDVQRADKISTPGMIDAQIINSLLNADLVIADLTSLNPNAFYEIGIRHMAQKPIIHMQAADEKIPFDVSLFRSIKYSILRPRDLRDAQTALKSQIEAVLASGYRVDNPVTRTRGVVELQKDATAGEKILLEQIRSIDNRLANIENDFSSKRPGVRVGTLAEFQNNFAPKRPLGLADLAMSIITFRNRNGLTERQAEIIKQTLDAQFGLTQQMARDKTSIVFTVIGVAAPQKIIFSPSKGMESVEVEWSIAG